MLSELRSDYGKPIGTVVVMDKGREVARKSVEKWQEDLWKRLVEEYGARKNVVRVPKAAVEMHTTSPAFSPCVFNAAQDYLSAVFGRKLDDSDRDWLSRHPKAQPQGVPRAYILTAIQQLLEPYGMGISRVRVPKGQWAAGGDDAVWMKALGVNPIAICDNRE